MAKRFYDLGHMLAFLSCVAVSVVSGQQKAEPCDPSYCRLPDCYCGGADIPGDLRPEEIPQFVLLTFDDAVNGLNEKFFSELFKDRYNPNGCPIKVLQSDKTGYNILASLANNYRDIQYLLDSFVLCKYYGPRTSEYEY